MARSVRIEYSGAFYHVMARGNQGQAIFRGVVDRRYFLKVLSEACGRTGWRIHAWVLMGDHYHLLVETPEANLVEGMKWVQNTYTRRFNLRHGLSGRLFADRYKSVLVEGGGYYYETLLDYIHLNPVRARLVKPEKNESVLDYAWSSVAGGYALPSSTRPKWLAAESGLAAFELADTSEGRRKFVKRLDRRALTEGWEWAGLSVLDAEMDARCSHLQRGWYWGSPEFGERMLKLGEGLLKRRRQRSYRGSPEVREHGEKEALKILKEGLAACGLKEKQLQDLPGSDGRKVMLAVEIWEKTTVGLGWISEHLAMKSPANVSQHIRQLRADLDTASGKPSANKRSRAGH